MRDENATLRNENAALRDENATLRNENKQPKVPLEKNNTSPKRRQSQLVLLRNENAALRDENAALKDENKQLKLNKGLEAKIKELEAKIKELEAKIVEKQQLEQAKAIKEQAEIDVSQILEQAKAIKEQAEIDAVKLNPKQEAIQAMEETGRFHGEQEVKSFKVSEEKMKPWKNLIFPFEQKNPEILAVINNTRPSFILTEEQLIQAKENSTFEERLRHLGSTGSSALDLKFYEINLNAFFVYLGDEVAAEKDIALNRCTVTEKINFLWDNPLAPSKAIEDFWGGVASTHVDDTGHCWFLRSSWIEYFTSFKKDAKLIVENKSKHLAHSYLFKDINLKDYQFQTSCDFTIKDYFKANYEDHNLPEKKFQDFFYILLTLFPLLKENITIMRALQLYELYDYMDNLEYCNFSGVLTKNSFFSSAETSSFFLDLLSTHPMLDRTIQKEFLDVKPNKKIILFLIIQFLEPYLGLLHTHSSEKIKKKLKEEIINESL